MGVFYQQVSERLYGDEKVTVAGLNNGFCLILRYGVSKGGRNVSVTDIRVGDLQLRSGLRKAKRSEWEIRWFY